MTILEGDQEKKDIAKIKKKILDNDLKKKKVAKDIGITSVYLSYILNGKRPLTSRMKRKLFINLGIKLAPKRPER